ncbi:MAG: endonuclease/exonuclease/phosphatase family protein [Myxococcota bacterium]|nr:endonuclease/exonuclease/phosphatase family protein [Myxococcota bacterium]
MRRLLSFPLALLLVACDGAPSPPDAAALDAGPGDAGLEPVDAGPPPPTGPIRLATWNLETFPRAPQTQAEVARVVEAERLDLVAVQEITDPAAFAALEARLPGWRAIATDDDRWLQVGLLVREARFEVERTDVLFGSEGYVFPRSVLSAQLTVRRPVDASPVDFRILVLHLKAEIDEESRMRREAAIRRLDNLVRGQLSDPALEHDIVIAGDWNDELGDPPDENVFGPMLDAPDVYRFLTRELERSGEVTFLPFPVFLDHVAMTADALASFGPPTTIVRHLERTDDDYRDTLSDHLPVIVELPLQ